MHRATKPTPCNEGNNYLVLTTHSIAYTNNASTVQHFAVIEEVLFPREIGIWHMLSHPHSLAQNRPSTFNLLRCWWTRIGGTCWVILAQNRPSILNHFLICLRYILHFPIKAEGLDAIPIQTVQGIKLQIQEKMANKEISTATLLWQALLQLVSSGEQKKHWQLPAV